MAFDLKTIAFCLAINGDTLINLDENKTGADDLAGELSIYAADVIQAVTEKIDLPELPDILAKGTTERITGAGRVILIVASSWLQIAVRQLPQGKPRTALEYVRQAIQLLLANKPVPAFTAK